MRRAVHFSAPYNRHVSRRQASSAVAPLERSAGGALLAILLVLIGALAYANSLHGPFVLDDQESIVNNASIRQLWPPGAAWFAEHESPVAGRPVVDMTLGANYAFGG